jgi:uncharacterized protein YgiM (DUF1202 family)
MMKKLLSLLMIFALVLVMPALAEEMYGICTTPTSDGAAYVRRTAGEGQPIVGSARNGDQLKILYKGNTWHKVQVVRTGVSGWMYGAYITFTDSVTEINHPGTVSSNAGYANFRRGPGTDTALICRLNNGTPLQVLRKTGSWYYVYHEAKNTYGYISAGLVQLGLDVPEWTGGIEGNAQVESSDGFANLRRGPGTGYGIVVELQNGVRVEMLETSGNWTRVNVPASHHYGWVYADLLRADSDTLGLVYDTGSVNSADGFANLRTDPGTNYPVLAKLYNDVLVSMLETKGDWVEVQLSDAGQTGWVYAKLLQTVESRGTMVTTGNVNLRSGPGVEYAQKTKLEKGTAVSVLSTSGNFARVNAAGWIGWVSLNYLK